MATGRSLASVVRTYSARDLVYVYVFGRPSRREGVMEFNWSSDIQLGREGVRGEGGKGRGERERGEREREMTGRGEEDKERVNQHNYCHEDNKQFP